MTTPSDDELFGTRVAVVVGKGGVGSSTVAAAYALAAARRGADVLFTAVDGRPGMGTLLGGRPLDEHDQVLHDVDGAGRVRGRTVPASSAFEDYLELKGVRGLLRRAATAASLPMIAAATPGLENLLVLGKVKEMDRDREADLVVVDAPPAGHATPFLRSASGLAEAVASGPVREQADEVQAMLTDAARCRAMVVTWPEQTPVTEALQLLDDLDDLAIARLPVVVNGCWPQRDGVHRSPEDAAASQDVTLDDATGAALGEAAAFGRAWLDVQAEQRARLADAVDGHVLALPRLPTARLGFEQVGALADALLDPQVEVAA